MNSATGKKGAKPVSLERFLRPNSKMDLIFSADIFREQTDVRNTVVLDMNAKFIAVEQTSPPILKSMIGREVEATLLARDPVTSELIRWGWNSQIIGLSAAYTAEDDKFAAMPMPAIFLALPDHHGLHSSNVRLDYRLEVGPDDNIAVKTRPDAPGAKLLNFSAKGAMIQMPGVPQLESGDMMHLDLVFPWPDEHSQTNIKSKAEVVRVDYVHGDRDTRTSTKWTWNTTAS